MLLAVTASLSARTVTPRHVFLLTVHGHAHGDALLEAAQLALVARDLVDDAAAFVFARVGRVEVLLNRSAEKTLKDK